MRRDFSQQYNIIYNIFKKSELSKSLKGSKLELARLLGVSQGKTQHWEKGQWPAADDLITIHAKLGCSYRWLVTGEGDPFEEESPKQSVSEQQIRIIELETELKEERRLNRELTRKMMEVLSIREQNKKQETVE